MAWSSGYKHDELPPPGYHSWHRRYYYDPCHYFCTCFCFLLFLLVIVLGVAALITYLALHPHKPRYTLQDVQITNLSIAGSSSSSSPIQDMPTSFYPYALMLSTEILVTVQIYNRNHHVGIYNNRLIVVLYYEDTEIGRTFLPSFYQEPQELTVLQSTISVYGYPIKQSVAASLSAAETRSAIPLHSLIATRVKYKIGSWKPAWHRWFYSNCDIVVGTSNSPSGAHILFRNC
ncbi:hypothetical protein O6H91_12G027600 [Diphasiastrum complanatum]|uniref:Uncharacterized protein n=2 Tax=Diphasiastrum complanatum TaxID=34168 RepID=A0ACC2BZW0_DIPCM|nr:hypothetical protein O6H91_Y315100 [Diphasiastrum complanatum]KAJ7535317.1 hypothetical protein O6H91_12G027600 [Diphasiastrum complanatum]